MKKVLPQISFQIFLTQNVRGPKGTEGNLTNYLYQETLPFTKSEYMKENVGAPTLTQTTSPCTPTYAVQQAGGGVD
jgi:hypothetical protein